MTASNEPCPQCQLVPRPAHQCKRRKPPVRDLNGNVVSFAHAKTILKHRERKAKRILDNSNYHEPDLLDEMGGSLEQHYADLADWGVEFGE